MLVADPKEGSVPWRGGGPFRSNDQLGGAGLIRFFGRIRKEPGQEPISELEALSPAALAEAWGRILAAERRSWVVFRHGTCVVLADPAPDPPARARALMRAWGPVHPGTSAGDFTVLALADNAGWLVTSHHPDIVTYVSHAEVPRVDTPDIAIGPLGRSKRDHDAHELQVVHVGGDGRAGWAVR